MIRGPHVIYGYTPSNLEIEYERVAGHFNIDGETRCEGQELTLKLTYFAATWKECSATASGK